MFVSLWIFIGIRPLIVAHLIDRFAFEHIIESLWQYPLIKQALIQLCSDDVEQCRNEQIISSYINLIDDKDLKKILQHRIHCFIHRTRKCRRRDLMITRRRCQFHRQCPTKSRPIDSSTKHFPLHWFFLFIPLIFTLICLPMWIFYYVYEIDFKIHSCCLRLCSLWTKRDPQRRITNDQEKNSIVD